MTEGNNIGENNPIDPKVKKAFLEDLEIKISQANVFDPKKEAEVVSDSLIDILFPNRNSEKTKAEILLRNIISITEHVSHSEMPKAIYDLMQREIKARELKCLCKDEEKHGSTSIHCCNHCGFPIEEFWTNK